MVVTQMVVRVIMEILTWLVVRSSLLLLPKLLVVKVLIKAVVISPLLTVVKRRDPRLFEEDLCECWILKSTHS